MAHGLVTHRHAAHRLVTAWCPDWPVVAADIGPDVPAAVVHANRVLARTAAAAAAGVRPGHRRREAQRCCPELVLLDHDPARDARGFEPVIRAVTELTPRVDVVEPGWLCFPARGPSRSLGGDRAVADRVAAIVAEVLGGKAVAIGVGVADGRAASAIAARRAAARAGSRSLGVTVVEPGGSVEFLAPLPVAALRELGDLDPELVDLLGRLGVGTFGRLAALPAGDVLARFGPAGRHAHRIATGDDERLAATSDPPPERCVERHLDEPVTQLPTVVFVAKQLADQLSAHLATEGGVCTRLVVTVETEHGERSERAWYRDGGLTAAAMVERVRWQLDGWVAGPDAPTAGVVLVRLTPDEVRRDDGRQLGFWGGRSRADHEAARAVTRLVGVAGDEAVQVVVPAGGRLPGERFRWVPATTVDLEASPTQRSATGEVGPWPGTTPAPSPAVVTSDAIPAEVLDEADRAVRVTGRGEVSAPPARLVVGGRSRPIRAWTGPWPLDQRWWEPRRHRRLARVQAVTDDGAAHLLVAEHQRWWLVATYA